VTPVRAARVAERPDMNRVCALCVARVAERPDMNRVSAICATRVAERPDMNRVSALCAARVAQRSDMKSCVGDLRQRIRQDGAATLKLRRDHRLWWSSFFRGAVRSPAASRRNRRGVGISPVRVDLLPAPDGTYPRTISPGRRHDRLLSLCRWKADDKEYNRCSDPAVAHAALSPGDLPSTLSLHTSNLKNTLNLTRLTLSSRCRCPILYPAAWTARRSYGRRSAADHGPTSNPKTGPDGRWSKGSSGCVINSGWRPSPRSA
jgi:hypothetical protein